MTKQELTARVNELESMLPRATPPMPPAIKAHEAGAALRQHIVQTTSAVAKGAVVTGAVTKGFFAGLLGR